MASSKKVTTFLTGVEVCKTPHLTLSDTYRKILKALARLPKDVAYRKYTEAIVLERIKALKESKTVEEIETKIDCGQVEELIIQGQNELNLARQMYVWKPWEKLLNEPPADQWIWPPAERFPQC